MVELSHDFRPIIGRGPPLGAAFVTLSILSVGLMVADHQGIFGLGLLLTIGATCAMVASLVVLPVILRILPAPARAEGAAIPASTA